MPERPPPRNEAQDASTLRASPLPEWQLGKLCLRVREGPAGGSSSTSLQASVWGKTHGRGATPPAALPSKGTAPTCGPGLLSGRQGPPKFSSRILDHTAGRATPSPPGPLTEPSAASAMLTRLVRNSEQLCFLHVLTPADGGDDRHGRNHDPYPHVGGHTDPGDRPTPPRARCVICFFTSLLGK